MLSKLNINNIWILDEAMICRCQNWVQLKFECPCSTTLLKNVFHFWKLHNQNRSNYFILNPSLMQHNIWKWIWRLNRFKEMELEIAIYPPLWQLFTNRQVSYSDFNSNSFVVISNRRLTKIDLNYHSQLSKVTWCDFRANLIENHCGSLRIHCWTRFPL